MLELTGHHGPDLFVARHKAHGHGIVAGRRQGQFLALGPVAQKRIGNLNQTASAIANHGICTHSAAMIDIEQDLQALTHDIMGLGALDIGNKTNAASIMLVAGIVQTLLNRQLHLNTLESHSPHARTRRAECFC